ncbi:hypothetical protein RND81_08G223000 [Saponaria officinalis]|uniref:Uncharacterized protein n=1 Tax=Saponaria officinalis TaxID=3572 RepID=A0AAW1JB84_SAPOF
MEPAKIDWELIDSVFVEDQVYENINAPQWVDLLSPISPNSSQNDVTWFCRKDCKHPRTAEDFLNSTPPCSSSKLLRSVSVSKLIEIVDWTRREPNLKKRTGVVQSSTTNDDAENQNPNFSTPTNKIKRADEAKKAPISLALNNIRRKEEEKMLLPIRTNPPTPQGFSATRDPDSVKSTPSKGPKSRLMEKDIVEKHDEHRTKNASMSEGKERRAFDVFWFFKPCTLST